MAAAGRELAPVGDVRPWKLQPSPKLAVAVASCMVGWLASCCS